MTNEKEEKVFIASVHTMSPFIRHWIIFKEIKEEDKVIVKDHLHLVSNIVEQNVIQNNQAKKVRVKSPIEIYHDENMSEYDCKWTSTSAFMMVRELSSEDPLYKTYFDALHALEVEKLKQEANKKIAEAEQKKKLALSNKKQPKLEAIGEDEKPKEEKGE